MTTHTPGPWHVNAERVFGADGAIASMNDASPNWQEDRELIAAAPDMLAALKAVLALVEVQLGSVGVQVRAAIAKAEGTT